MASNGQSIDNFLFRICEDENCELGTPTGYVDSKGDTIIPLSYYYYCYTDTLKNFAVVLDKNGICKAIDKTGNILYEVKWFDNGPDYLSDGLFQIIIDGKTGYANKKGEVVINPAYSCTTPFKNGKAKVSYDCELVEEGEFTRMKSEGWFFIDKKGNKIE